MNCKKCLNKKCISFNKYNNKYLIKRIRIYSGIKKRFKVHWKCGDQTWEIEQQLLLDIPSSIWKIKYKLNYWTPYQAVNIDNNQYIIFFKKRQYKCRYRKMLYKNKLWCEQNISHLI